MTETDEEIRPGTVVLIGLDPTKGHEQRGTRPCIIVSDPDIIGDQRYPVMAVVPITKTPGHGALYPKLLPGSSGLHEESYALIDQVRSVDKRRVVKMYGEIRDEDLDSIDEGLRLFLGL